MTSYDPTVLGHTSSMCMPALKSAKIQLNRQFLEMQGVCVCVEFVSRERGSVIDWRDCGVK